MSGLSRIVFVLLTAAVGLPAIGAEPEKSRLQFEIAPFIGLRGGGDFDIDPTSQSVDLEDATSLALALNLRIDETSQYELFYGRQATNLKSGAPPGDVDIDVEYLHLGGTVTLNEDYRVIPYGVGGLGVTRFHPDFAGANDETRFSISLGAGLRVPVSERFSLRLEGRGYLTFVDTDTSFFCRSGEAGAFCSLRGSGSTFIQYELLAGASFAF